MIHEIFFAVLVVKKSTLHFFAKSGQKFLREKGREFYGQFHQHFTSNFCANFFAPKNYKAKL
jgi:hypothetical protein